MVRIVEIARTRFAFLTFLALLAVDGVGCDGSPPDANPPAGNAPENSEKRPSFFKNPAPPFEVVLGEVDKTAPMVQFVTAVRLRRPLAYRQWIFIGGRILAGTETVFESYYLHPRSFHAMKQDRHWPEHVVLACERAQVVAAGRDFHMGEPRGLSVAVRDADRFAARPGHWAFFDFGSKYPLADNAEPDGRAWFDDPDELLAYCPLLRQITK